MFVVYRIVGGVGIGLASALSRFTSRKSARQKRGRFVAINQLTIVIGVLAAQLINLMIAEPVATGATQQMIVETERADGLALDVRRGTGAGAGVSGADVLFLSRRAGS